MKLTSKARAKIPAGKFAGPNRSFPVNDRAHAKAAIMDSKYAPPGDRAKIVARARGVLDGVKK